MPIQYYENMKTLFVESPISGPYLLSFGKYRKKND